MSEQSPSFEETYAKLKQSYIERLHSNLAEIRDIEKKAELEPVGREELQKIRILAHGLSGSGTTFGFPDITMQGRRTEQLADKLLKGVKDEDVLNDEDVVSVRIHLSDLATACDIAKAPAARSAEDIDFASPEKAVPLDGKSRLSVLVVDDDSSLTALISLKLTQREFGVMTAHNGKEALASIKERRPDMIILDINMPGASGHDVLRSLKQDPETVAIPVLMLTASAKQQDVVGALHSGALDYVVKPVDINDLVARVEKLCRNLRRTILIADNDQLILTLLNHRFRSKGLNVILTDNGIGAWDAVQKYKPDMVLLDIQMPGMDGFGVMDKMKSTPETASIPVVVVSAHKEQSDIDAAKKAGARDYVIKPLTTDNLLSRCMQILNEKTPSA